jgi:hypothetical protein
MKKRSIVIVALLTVLLVLAFAGTASAWSHSRGAAPILDKVTGPSGGPYWCSYDVYWDTSGAKPLYVVAESDGGAYAKKLTHAHLVAGYMTLSLPAGNQFHVYLETRKGIQSNIIDITVPPTPPI